MWGSSSRNPCSGYLGLERKAIIYSMVAIRGCFHPRHMVGAVQRGLNCFDIRAVSIKLAIPLSIIEKRPFGLHRHRFDRGSLVLPNFEVLRKSLQGASLNHLCSGFFLVIDVATG